MGSPYRKIAAGALSLLPLLAVSGEEAHDYAPFLAAARDAFSGAEPDNHFQDALAGKYYNIEIDVVRGGSGKLYETPAYLAGKEPLYAAKSCAPNSPRRDLFKYFDDLAARITQNQGSAHGDGKNFVLVLDVKEGDPGDMRPMAESLAAILNSRPDIHSSGNTTSGAFEEKAVTIWLAGSEKFKESYFAHANQSGGQLRAFRDKDHCAQCPRFTDVSHYFREDASLYHRFYSLHWSHVESGFAGQEEGKWLLMDRRRMESLLILADFRGYQLRFYPLDQAHFTGGPLAAKRRWYRFITANNRLKNKSFLAVENPSDLPPFLQEAASGLPKVFQPIQQKPPENEENTDTSESQP